MSLQDYVKRNLAFTTAETIAIGSLCSPFLNDRLLQDFFQVSNLGKVFLIIVFCSVGIF